MIGLAWIVRAGLVLSALLFAAIAVISKTMIEPEGLAIFDSRLAGYDVQDAVAFLGLLTAEQRGVYLGLFRGLDTVFPVVLAASLLCVIWGNTRGERRNMRIAAVLGPVLYLVFDLFENAQVARILVSGVGVQATMVETAATYTQAKWMCLALSLLVVFWAWRFAAKESAG